MPYLPAKSGFTLEDLQRMGPSEVDRRKALAAALLARSSEVRPIGSMLEGMAQLAQALSGKFQEYRADKAERLGKQSASDDFGAATIGFPAAPGGSGSGGGVAAAPGGGGDYRSGIAGIESGGRYDALGPETKGDRAYGKYQIMGANVGPWTQAALGKRMTPQQFLQDKAAQDATFDKIFGGYVQRFGPEGAAQAWFGGPGSVGKTYRSDVLGTNVGDYGKRFIASLGGGGSPAVAQAAPAVDPVQVASLDPSVGVAKATNPYADQGVSDEQFRRMQEGESAAPVPMPGQPTVAPQQTQIAQALIQGGGGQDPAQTLGAPALSPAQIMTGQQAAQRNALGNEWLNPGQRQLIESLVGNQIEMGDPRTQLDMQIKQEQLNALRGKKQKNWQKLDDNTLFDPDSGETRDIGGAGNNPLFQGTGLDAQAWNILQNADPSSKEYATAYAIVSQPKTQLVQTANGMMPVEVPPQLPSWLQPPGGQAAPSAVPNTGGVEPAAGAATTPSAAGAVIPGTQPKPTEASSRNATITTTLANEIPIINETWGALADPTSQLIQAIPGGLGNAFQNENYQRAFNSIQDSATNILYSLSGASSNPGEAFKKGAAFIPKFGDKPGAIKDKLSRFKAHIKGIALQSQDPALIKDVDTLLAGLTGTPAAAAPRKAPQVIDGITIEELP